VNSLLINIDYIIYRYIADIYRVKIDNYNDDRKSRLFEIKGYTINDIYIALFNSL
jgi:hypothetical protein